MRSAVVFCVWVSLATISLSNAAEFSQTYDLPPLKLGATDLDAILHKTHSLIAAANGPSSEQHFAQESVKLSVSGKEIEIPHFSIASSVAFPKEVFRFSYTYYQPDEPISSVVIDLSDYSRRVLVTGEVSDQVESISKMVESDLLRHSTAIGGAKFRRAVGVCLSVGLLTSLGLSGAHWWRTRAYNALGIVIFSALSLSLVLFVPWDRYLPGFVLYQTYSPFLLVRYAPQIFILSLIAALLGIPLSYFLWRGKA